jgi:outer membrane lipopolysaccharide assembly protein LptE/RlpB
MILNLTKNFSFADGADNYEVTYSFSEEGKTKEVRLPGNIWLQFSCKGKDTACDYSIQVERSMLYQSNEAIEKIVAEKALKIMPVV